MSIRTFAELKQRISTFIINKIGLIDRVEHGEVLSDIVDTMESGVAFDPNSHSIEEFSDVTSVGRGAIISIEEAQEIANIPKKTSDLTNDALLESITAGANISIDLSNPRNPVIIGVGVGGDGGTIDTVTSANGDITVNATDPSNIVLTFANASGFQDATQVTAIIASALSLLTKADVGLNNVDNTADADKPVSTAQQLALNAKLSSIVAGANISIDLTDPLNPIITGIGAGGDGGTVDTVASANGDITVNATDPSNVIVTFTNASGFQDASEVTTAIASAVSALTKASVGLNNVDNTADADKPISSAQQLVFDTKSNATHNHDGTYEPADATILKDADISATVQPFNADTVIDADYVHTDENYTQSEKAKVASFDATHYLSPLQTTVALTALAEASLIDKARVYVEDELSDYFFDTQAGSGDFAPDDQTGGVGFWKKVAVDGETPASIKTKYESNADTNGYTDAEKAKLVGVEANAQVNTPTTSGSDGTTVADLTKFVTRGTGFVMYTALQVWTYISFKISSLIGSTIQPYNANTVVDGSYVHTDNNYTSGEKNSVATIANKADKISLATADALSLLKSDIGGQYETSDLYIVKSVADIQALASKSGSHIALIANTITIANDVISLGCSSLTIIGSATLRIDELNMSAFTSLRVLDIQCPVSFTYSSTFAKNLGTSNINLFLRNSVDTLSQRNVSITTNSTGNLHLYYGSTQNTKFTSANNGVVDRMTSGDRTDSWNNSWNGDLTVKGILRGSHFSIEVDFICRDQTDDDTINLFPTSWTDKVVMFDSVKIVHKSAHTGAFATTCSIDPFYDSSTPLLNMDIEGVQTDVAIREGLIIRNDEGNSGNAYKETTELFPLASTVQFIVNQEDGNSVDGHKVSVVITGTLNNI